MSCTLSFREQLQALLDENIEKYPDAIRWMMEVSAHIDLDRETEYERFVERLNGNSEFSNHPYDPNSDNIVQLIKWYKNNTGSGLRDAKKACEDFIKLTYPNCTRAQQYR